MDMRILFVVVLFFISKVEAKKKLDIQSASISYPGGPIEEQYTCDGKNISPQIGWSAGPKGTKSYVLICESQGTVHWIMYDIPASVNLILDGQPAKQIGAKVGVNSYGKKKYSGPCPSGGSVQNYYFLVYAADVPELTINGEPTKSAIMQALVNHTLAQGKLMGRYERQKK